MMNGTALKHLLIAALLLFVLPSVVWAAEIIKDKSFGAENEIIVEFAGPVEPEIVKNPDNYTIYEIKDPDIRLELDRVEVAKDNRSAALIFKEPLNTTETHIVSIRGINGEAEETFGVAKSYLGYLFSVLIGALLINNFVFTKYLGLCVFFGTSKRKTTAKGMGVVFTLVMVATGVMSWILYQHVLKPYNLTFLQIVVFIGLTSLTVQAIDTILRKVNPVLFNSFGVFLVLVIANCVVIAVPLIMASNEYNFFETFMLSLGAGGGFLLALYLMSSVSERLMLAKIPPTFKGLPIAFIVAGQFAMAFLGFSGLKIF
jgi:electron transport complex protein RnfA